MAKVLLSYDFQILVLDTSLYNFELIWNHEYFTLKNYVSLLSHHNIYL